MCSCLTFLPVGRRDLTGLGLRDGPAAEGLELVAHQRPPEEGPAGEAGGGGVETVAELQTTPSQDAAYSNHLQSLNR